MFKRPLIDNGKFSVRCYARKADNDQYAAVCLDLCLAAQADSMDEAKAKLHSQVMDYLMDALEEGNMETRPAPLSQWAVYYRLSAQKGLKDGLDGLAAVFRDSVPLEIKPAA
ncbi:hypothetical protein [Alcanivorax sp.]|uniref:hypothetical protein n=1 Tax=Alcanivorax sp. TaxID=1872427 RepID=UPI003A907306